ncbi:MAG: carboxypeptidase, partial [Gemmatimonadales bacterium]
MTIDLRALALLLTLATPLASQARPTTPPAQERRPATPAATDESAAKFPTDSTIQREAVVTIGGQKVPYRVAAGYQPVWDDKGATIATLFHTYYERTDVS